MGYRGTAECFKCKFFNRNLSFCGKFQKKLVDFGGSFPCEGYKKDYSLKPFILKILYRIIDRLNP